MINVEKVKPTGLFTNYVYKAIPLAFDESMSYYETLCGLLSYLKDTVIPALNNNADAIVEVQELMTQLQNYVDNYFDNLDVQEEINTKLDEMAESGVLEEIMADYLDTRAVFGFDSVADMKEATNLTNGSFARTLGYYNINDGGEGLYKIREITNEDIVDEGSIIALSDITLIAELIAYNEINPNQFGAYGDGTHDDTDYFRNALTYLGNKNGGILYLKNNKKYKLTDNIELPANVSLQGSISFNDVSGKANYVVDENILNGMATLLMVDDAEILLDGNNDIEKICIAYPEQNYEIESVEKSVQHPDGLTEFVQYNPTFSLIGNYIGLVLKDIIYLGGTQILYCSKDVNPEKLYVDRIIGMCVGTAFKIVNAKDIMNFNNIHLNANSLKCYIQKVYDGSDTNFYTKCAKNSVVFSFGDKINDVNYGCDGSYFTNCFAYGVKRFIELLGNGNSVQLNNCGCDVCHEFLYVNSNVKPFGTFLNNCTATPIVYNPIVDGVESTDSPSFIRIKSNDHRIHVTNSRVFGSNVALITDSDVCNYILSCSSSSQNTRVDIVNSTFTGTNLQQGFNTIGKNDVEQRYANSLRVLTLTNVTLNGYCVDSNINQSKVLLTYVEDPSGLQTISGIGFRPNNIEIVGYKQDTKMKSHGISDGITSKATTTDSNSSMFGSGGTAVILEIATDINNRRYAELNSLNDDGFVLNWKTAGTAPTGRIYLTIICRK